MVMFDEVLFILRTLNFYVSRKLFSLFLLVSLVELGHDGPSNIEKHTKA